MNSQPVFETAQEFLRQGDTDQALQLLIQFLEKEGTQPEYLRTLRVVESNFNAARQRERKGILEFSDAQREYAKSNDAILEVLENLVSGKKTTTGFQGTGDGSVRNTRLYWLIGGGILLVLGVAAGYYLMGRKTPKEELVECPKFRPEGFRVMVLEFQKLSGEDSKPELGIQTRIRDLTEKNNMNTDVRILPSKSFDGITPGNREATEIGNQCQANLVVWGQYEKVKDSISLDIRYAFTDPTWPPGAAIETFKNVSEIKADQMKISNLDDAVFRLCTAMALHENRMDLAEKWLNKIQTPNARETQWKKKLKK
jgi:uncharacterized protein YneF (UPF0154 family)